MFNSILCKSRLVKTKQRINRLNIFLFLANYLLESIDESVQPCDNFFKFACGTWLKNNRIPDDSKFLFKKLYHKKINNLFYSKPVLKIHSMCYELN